MAIHTGHRSRVKEKFRNDGFDQFADHEVLEALLFYAIPYRDTNPIAHQLIEKAGNLSRVFDLDRRTISSVPYCGDHTALFLRLVAEIAKRSLGDTESSSQYATDEARRALAIQTVANVQEDETHILLFDNHYRLIDTKCIFHGSYTAAAFRPSLAIEAALVAHASMVVLVSTHKDRVARPDPYEVDATTNLFRTLELLDIHLLDHYIVSGNVSTSILQIITTKTREIRDSTTLPLFRMVTNEEEKET